MELRLAPDAALPPGDRAPTRTRWSPSSATSSTTRWRPLGGATRAAGCRCAWPATPDGRAGRGPRLRPGHRAGPRRRGVPPRLHHQDRRVGGLARAGARPHPAGLRDARRLGRRPQRGRRGVHGRSCRTRPRAAARASACSSSTTTSWWRASTAATSSGCPASAVVGRGAHRPPTRCGPCEQSRPDLVLLDVYLPDASGLDVLRGVRAERRRRPRRRRRHRGARRRDGARRDARRGGGLPRQAVHLRHLRRPAAALRRGPRGAWRAAASWSRPTSTAPSTWPAGPARHRCPRACRRRRATSSPRRCARPAPTCPRSRRPSGSASPGSAPAATSSTWPAPGRRRCARGTAAPAGPSTGTPGRAETTVE